MRLGGRGRADAVGQGAVGGWGLVSTMVVARSQARVGARQYPRLNMRGMTCCAAATVGADGWRFALCTVRAQASDVTCAAQVAGYRVRCAALSDADCGLCAVRCLSFLISCMHVLPMAQGLCTLHKAPANPTPAHLTHARSRQLSGHLPEPTCRHVHPFTVDVAPRPGPGDQRP